MKKNNSFNLIVDLRNGLKFYFVFSQDSFLTYIKEGIKSNNLLKEFDNQLKKKFLNIKDLKSIGLVNGGKSFTSLRIGIIWANFFSLYCQIPVIGITEKEIANMNDQDIVNFFLNKNKKLQSGKLLSPNYYTKANITKRKPLW